MIGGRMSLKVNYLKSEEKAVIVQNVGHLINFSKRIYLLLETLKIIEKL